MVFWALGLIPYWILVRHGNFVHDYYFLPFFVPMAYLGARAILRIPIKPLRWLVIRIEIGSHPPEWRRLTAAQTKLPRNRRIEITSTPGYFIIPDLSRFSSATI